MPYTEQELEANDHYQSLKARDEVIYIEKVGKALQRFLDRELKNYPNEIITKKQSLREKDDSIRLYEDPITGESYIDPTQNLNIEIYQRRYRTKDKTFEYIDRDFKEL
tara:strand:- start:6749 stop:7072 length:324 start_codon:yes stop_codon:yes gene_type:complete